MEDKKIKIRFCKICGLCETQTRFQISRKTCIKCNSKKCNEMRGNEYFAKYMKDHYIPNGGKRGRPKKEIIVEI